MPRKLRSPKPRRGRGVPVSEALFYLLTWDDLMAADALETPDANRWELFDNGSHHEAAWQSIVDEALLEWTHVFPGTRPKSWWHWTAPELRRIYGRFTALVGLGRCQPTGLPFGQPDDPTDLPMCESQAQYLDRLGLWLDGERERVDPSAFEPQPFSWRLTRAPRRGPDDDDEDEA